MLSELRVWSNIFPPLPQTHTLFPAQGLAHIKLSTYMFYEYWKEYILQTHMHLSVWLPPSHMSPASLGYPGIFPPLYFMSFSSYRLCSVLNFYDVSFTFPSLHQAQQAGRLHNLAQYCRDSHSWICLSLFMRLTANHSLLLGDFKE